MASEYTLGQKISGIGAMLGGTIPEFDARMEQLDEKRMEAMYKDAGAAYDLFNKGNLAGIIDLANDRLSLLQRIPGSDPSDTMQILQLAQAGGTDPNARNQLGQILEAANIKGIRDGYFKAPALEEDYTLSPQEVRYRGRQIIARGIDKPEDIPSDFTFGADRYTYQGLDGKPLITPRVLIEGDNPESSTYRTATENGITYFIEGPNIGQSVLKVAQESQDNQAPNYVTQSSGNAEELKNNIRLTPQQKLPLTPQQKFLNEFNNSLLNKADDPTYEYNTNLSRLQNETVQQQMEDKQAERIQQENVERRAREAALRAQETHNKRPNPLTRTTKIDNLVPRLLNSNPDFTQEDAENAAVDIVDQNVVENQLPNGDLQLFNRVTNEISTINLPSPELFDIRPPAGYTLWELAGDAQGVKAAILGSRAAELLNQAGIPLSEETFSAQAQYRLAANPLIRALSNSSRYPVAEQNQIAKDINIKPSTWSSEPATKVRLKAMTISLTRRVNQLKNDTNNRNLTTTQRSESAILLSEIESFLAIVGMPQQVPRDNPLSEMTVNSLNQYDPFQVLEFGKSLNQQEFENISPEVRSYIIKILQDMEE